MKILLLNPPFMPRYSRSSRSPCVTKGGTLYYPYFLAYACGALEKNNFNVKLIDAIANDWSHEDTLNYVKSIAPELIVVDTSTPSIYNDVEFADKIKSVLPHSHITLVGTHPSRLVEETFALSSNVDSICRGEYDLTVVELAKAIEANLSLENVAGISFRKEGKIIHNKDRPLMTSEQLDELPFVSEIYKKHFGMEGIKKYFYASLLHPQITILTARGCPYNCSFCNIPFKSSYRARSPENVVDEFEFIQNELPEVKEVMIEDDTFPVSKERTIEICRLLRERNIKVTWSCNARVNTDFETLKEMKKSGCRLLCVGFESPVQSVLDEVHKRTTAEMQIKFMEDCRKIGILVNGCFILGMPGDTRKTVMETIEFAKRLNPDTAQFYSAYAYPATEMWEWAKKNGYLTSERYDALLTESGQHKGNVNLPDIPAEEADRLCTRALREFYLRKEYIFYKFKQIVTNFEEAKRTIISGKTFFRHVLFPQQQPASP